MSPNLRNAIRMINNYAYSGHTCLKIMHEIDTMRRIWQIALSLEREFQITVDLDDVLTCSQEALDDRLKALTHVYTHNVKWKC